MASGNDSLKFAYREIGGWQVPTFELVAAGSKSVSVAVRDVIMNSVVAPKDKDRLQDWKVKVASEVRASRGGRAWSPGDEFAISVGFSFNGRNHGNRDLDVENFLKPVVDAIAAGLFCEEYLDLKNIGRWDYDDSNFNTLLIHRLPDARRPWDEGVAISISSSSRG